MLASAYVALFVMRIGGVILTLTADRGIHSGDLGAIPVALVGAALLLVALRPAYRHSVPLVGQAGLDRYLIRSPEQRGVSEQSVAVMGVGALPLGVETPPLDSASVLFN